MSQLMANPGFGAPGYGQAPYTPMSQSDRMLWQKLEGSLSRTNQQLAFGQITPADHARATQYILSHLTPLRQKMQQDYQRALQMEQQQRVAQGASAGMLQAANHNVMAQQFGNYWVPDRNHPGKYILALPNGRGGFVPVRQPPEKPPTPSRPYNEEAARQNAIDMLRNRNADWIGLREEDLLKKPEFSGQLKAVVDAHRQGWSERDAREHQAAQAPQQVDPRIATAAEQQVLGPQPAYHLPIRELRGGMASTSWYRNPEYQNYQNALQAFRAQQGQQLPPEVAGTQPWHPPMASDQTAPTQPTPAGGQPQSAQELTSVSGPEGDVYQIPSGWPGTQPPPNLMEAGETAQAQQAASQAAAERAASIIAQSRRDREEAENQ